MRSVLLGTNRKLATDKTMTSQRRMYFRLPLLGLAAALLLLLAAESRGLAPEEGVVGDVMDTWSMSCSEAELRCHVDITCRVLLETIDKVCDHSGTIQRRNLAVSRR